MQTLMIIRIIITTEVLIEIFTVPEFLPAEPYQTQLLPIKFLHCFSVAFRNYKTEQIPSRSLDTFPRYKKREKPKNYWWCPNGLKIISVLLFITNNQSSISIKKTRRSAVFGSSECHLSPIINSQSSISIQ